MATTRYEERIAASLGQSGSAPVKFEESQGVCGSGVLFMLPALIQQGLLKSREVYQLPDSHYYGVESIVLTLAFMGLARIKNPEQLKQCKPGEIGKFIGLDRVPEVKCLREKIKLLSRQEKAVSLNNSLIDWWYQGKHQGDAAFFYLDGHQRIYYGYQANLPAKFISRQKLCLSATTEFWVNDAAGMPVMMVMGELNEKLQTVIEENIIPRMLENGLLVEDYKEQETPQCTFIFDREAYDTAFFCRLWENHRIAVITYRKNVSDKWEENDFKPYDVSLLEENQTVNMQLCEKETEIAGNHFREVRKLSEGGHQTAIIATHPTLALTHIAARMFGRWCQENFFRYLIQDYDFDKMIEFGTQSIEPDKEVVNPVYRKLTHRIKKLREKIQRLEAKFYPLAEEAMDKNIDQIPAITKKQMEYKEKIDAYKQEEAQVIEQRQQYAPRITLAEMPQQERYNKLKTESKLLMNVIKMICYRAESAVTCMIAPHLKRAKEEKRMFIKQIIKSHADLIPDEKNKTLTVVLHSLSAQRYNQAANNLAQLLNETETLFPGSDLRMIFKTTALSDCER